MLLWYFGFITLVHAQTENPLKDLSSESYLHLTLIHNLPPKDQYRTRVGFERASIGSESLPVVDAPLNFADELKPLHLWYREKETFHACDKKAEFNTVYWMSKSFQSLSHQLSYVQKKVADGQLPEIMNPYINTVSSARMQFMTRLCLQRQHFKSAEAFRKGEWTLSPDHYRFCPSTCGAREGPGMDEKQRARLNRYTDPCSYPTVYSPYTSRACVEVKNESYFAHQESFHCQCLPGAKWLSHSKVCSHAVEETTVPCNPLGTSHMTPVQLAPDEHTFSTSNQLWECTCKPNYYGTYCDKLKDPCKMTIGNALPGNVACGVLNGNECIPDFNSSRYKCKCRPEYDRIPPGSYPPGRLMDNCLREVNPCALLGCLHGICVLTDHGVMMELLGRLTREPMTWLGRQQKITARCLCNAGWIGKKCGEPAILNGWLPWSPWSACEPACQTSLTQKPSIAAEEMVPEGQSTPRWGVRQRTRKRYCMGMSHDCRVELQARYAQMGITIEAGYSPVQYERRACRPRPCDRHLYLAMGKRAIRRSRIQGQVRATLKQSYTVHLWTVLAFTFVFAIFAFFAAFATKMHSEEAYDDLLFGRAASDD